jgi:hypothetical protein
MTHAVEKRSTKKVQQDDGDDYIDIAIPTGQQSPMLEEVGQETDIQHIASHAWPKRHWEVPVIISTEQQHNRLP